MGGDKKKEGGKEEERERGSLSEFFFKDIYSLYIPSRQLCIGTKFI